MKGRKLGLMQPIKARQKQKFRNSNVSLLVPSFRNPGARLAMQHNLLQARGLGALVIYRLVQPHIFEGFSGWMNKLL